MKKFATLLTSMCMTLCVGGGLTACFSGGNNNESDEPIINTEFSEFSNIAVNVISDVNAVAISEADVAQAAEASVMSMSFRQTIDEDTAKTVYTDDLEMVKYVVEQGLGLPLVCGEIGNSYMELTNFYGINFFVEGHDLTIRTIKKEDTYFTYVYNADSDRYLVNRLVYKSDTDYEITYYEKYNTGHSYFYYNSELKGYGYVENDEIHEAYSIDLKETSYISINENALGEMEAVIENEVSSSDFSKQASGVVGIESDYSLTPAQFSEAFNKYINWGAMVYSEDGFMFDSEAGCLYGYKTDDPSVTAIKIPENCEAISASFHIDAPNVKTVYIPKTLKYIKIPKATLQFAQTGEYGPEKDRAVYVDCPVEFFGISCGYYFNGFSSESTKLSIENFVVEDGSPLFSEKDGSLYSKDGEILLYLADNPNVKKLEITCNRISESARNLLYRNISVLESVEYNADMICNYQGQSHSVNLLSEIINTMKDETNRPDIRINTVVINGVSDSENTIIENIINSIYNYNKTVKIGKIVINGDFSEISISDCIELGTSYSDAVIDDIVVNSTNPNCVISGVLSTEELTVYENCAEGELLIEYPKLKKLIIAEGVDTFYGPDISRQGQTLEVWLPSTIRNYRCHTYAEVTYRFAMNPLEFEYLKICNQIFIEGLPNEDADAWKTNVIFKTDEKEEQKLTDFEHYSMNTEKRTISIQGYYGTSEILVIPESIYGFTVTWFESYASTDTPLSATQIKEVHLTNSLEHFGVDYDWKLDKIVYNGTMAEFEELQRSEALVQDGITQTIECSDGTILADTLPIYHFTDTVIVCNSEETAINFNIENLSIRAENDGGLYLLTGKFEGVDISFQFDVANELWVPNNEMFGEKIGGQEIQYRGDFTFLFVISENAATITLIYEEYLVDESDGTDMRVRYSGTIESDRISSYIP